MSLKYDSPKKLRKEKKKWNPETPEDFEEMEDTFLKERILHRDPTISGSVRITAGKVKNFKLDIPRSTRPLTDRMKVQIFDTLKQDIQKKKILDLYAGTGSFGLEALSRGARHVTFIEASKYAYSTIQKNIEKTGLTSQTELIKSKAEEYLFKQINNEPTETFDIIFLDPPYKLFNTKKTFKMESIINMASKLLPGVENPSTKKFKGALILKHPKRYPLDKISLENIELIDSLQFGLNTVSFFIAKV
jgi:16S rRNA (guanine(966)-N(2))-methyltransferase RsmD